MIEEYKKLKLAYKFMRKNEGGKSNHKDDPGKDTLFGVSIVFHPIWYARLRTAYIRKNLNKVEELLLQFYAKKFYNKYYDEIHSAELVIRLFDFGVNAGYKLSQIFLQSAVNEYYFEIGLDTRIACDGKIGPISKDHINNCNTHRVLELFQRNIKIHYISRSTFLKFGPGWFNRLWRVIVH